MELLKLLANISALTVIGFSVLSLISRRTDKFFFWEKIAFSYGLGIGLVSLQMLIFYFLKVKFSATNILLPWVPVCVIGLFLASRASSEIVPAEKLKKRKDIFSAFLLGGISIEAFYALFRALIKPIESYDAIAIYAIKAKIFYLAKSIPTDFFANLVNLFPHPDYPINIPLAEAFLYIAMGNLNDQLVKIIFPLFFISILGLLYFTIRRFSTKRYALFFTFLLETIPQFNSYATNAYLDLVLSYYYLASALFLLRWIEDMDNLSFISLSALFCALAGWTKNEGMLYCAVNSAIVLFSIAANRRNITAAKAAKYMVLYFGIIALILFPWLLVKKIYHIKNDEINLANLSIKNLILQSYKIRPIIYEFQKQFFGPKKWNIIWPVVLFALIFRYKKAFSGAVKYITLSLILAIAGYCLFYMISYVEIGYFLSKSWSRFLLHFLPVAILWLAYLAKDELKFLGSDKG